MTVIRMVFMSMTMAEGRATVRSMLHEPLPEAYTDAEIDAWIELASRDVCAKVLCNRENKAIYVPANDMTTELNCLTDVILSGTPRVCVSESHYFKVYPNKSGSEAPSSDPLSWRTYDDAVLSGPPMRLGFAHSGYLYWTKGYPYISSADNPTIESIQALVYDVPDDVVSGDQSVFRILSGGNYYYFKAYRIANYAQCDETLTLPVPADNLKIFSVQKTVDGGKPRGLFCVHPSKVGHLDDAAGAEPSFFWEYAGKMGLMPGGCGAAGFVLQLHRAYFVESFTDIPDDLQPSCLYYAFVLACYKAGKFQTGAMVLKAYLQYLMQVRQLIYELEQDTREDFRLPERMNAQR